MQTFGIYRSTLMGALSLAIQTEKQIEKEHGYSFDSIFLTNIKELQKALLEGTKIEILE